MNSRFINLYPVLLVFFMLLTEIQSFAQSMQAVYLEGISYGHEYDPYRKILKKSKQTTLEGVLEGVVIEVYTDNKRIASYRTNNKGEFKLTLPQAMRYSIFVSKAGYNKISIDFDLRQVPEEIRYIPRTFSNLELLLNSFPPKGGDSFDEHLGSIFYNINSLSFDFKSSEEKGNENTGIFSRTLRDENAKDLVRRSVLKNINNFRPLAVQRSVNGGRRTPLNAPNLRPVTKNDSIIAGLWAKDSVRYIKIPFSDFNLDFMAEDADLLDASTLEAREMNLRKVKEQLDQDKILIRSVEDSFLLANREARLATAELELKNARLRLANQNRELESNKKLLQFGALALIMTFSAFILLFIFNREKTKNNKLLKSQQDRLNESLFYASKIQETILVSEKQLLQVLPESFIFYQPRDIVSGDFYWMHAINKEEYLLVVADCTGHGVPGAFMSMLGYALLNQTVLEKGITSPAAILSDVHKGILHLLKQERQESQIQDGMDMAVCKIDISSNQVVFAGAMQPLYLVRGEKIEFISGDSRSLGGKLGNKALVEWQFTEKTFQLQNTDCCYLITDGFMDQFGEELNEKFNLKRMKELLKRLNQVPMKIQKQSMESEFDYWKGNAQQTDDVLMIGFRLP